MKIFRVYEPFHCSDKSGTYEYGSYSTLAQAKDRMRKVWEIKKYPTPDKASTETCLFYIGFDEGTSIYISEISVDVDIEQTEVGYT